MDVRLVKNGENTSINIYYAKIEIFKSEAGFELFREQIKPLHAFPKNRSIGIQYKRLVLKKVTFHACATQGQG